MRRVRPLATVIAAVAAVLVPGTVRGGGFDTPVFYSARHVGMGGTAIGYVDDASAIFHNPAGLAQVPRLSLLGDFSLLLAHTHASPAVGAQDLDSTLTVAPVFLVGGAYRVTSWMVAGLALYPVASAGATYRYPVAGATVENRTDVLFAELSPSLAFNLPHRVRLGVGYRMTWVHLDRFQGVSGGGTPGLDFTMNGLDFAGLRVGAQWSPLDWVQVGAVYRHRTNIDVSADRGTAAGIQFTDLRTTFVLPSRLGVGARADRWHAGAALDVEYLFGSQNGAHSLTGNPPPNPGDPSPQRASVPNVFNWSGAITVRLGGELRLLPAPGSGIDRLALRLGYIYDGKTTNERYPSAFGTPPGPTHSLTAGAGWTQGRWRGNVAYAFRFGSGDVTAQDVNNPANQPCSFCGTAGADPYRLRLHGIYVDLGYQF